MTDPNAHVGRLTRSMTHLEEVLKPVPCGTKDRPQHRKRVLDIFLGVRQRSRAAVPEPSEGEK